MGANPASPAPSAPTPEQMLVALDVPLFEETRAVAAAAPGHELWRFGERLITPAAAKALWSEWHPKRIDQYADDTRLARDFRQLLLDGYDVGIRLGRFEAMSTALPNASVEDRQKYISDFEDCLAFDDFGSLRLHLSPEDYQALHRRDGKDRTLDELLQTMADEIFSELGLVFKPPLIQADCSLSPPWFRCEWNDMLLPPLEGLGHDEVIVDDTVERLTLLNIKGTKSANAANGSECARIAESYASLAEQAGLTTWDWRDYLFLCASAALRQAAGAFVNRVLIDLYAMRLREFSPELIDVVEQRFERSFVVQILRALLAEGISIRNLSRVLDASVELRAFMDADLSRYIVFPPSTGGVYIVPGLSSLAALEPHHYAEFIRTMLKREISHKYTQDKNTLVVYLLDPELEKRVGRWEGLDEQELANFLEAVKEEVGSPPSSAQNPVLLTSMEIRRQVKRLIAPDFPRVAVLSWQELSPDMNIQPIARISPEFEK